MLELYHDSLSREMLEQRSEESGIQGEIGHPLTSTPPSREWCPDMAKGEEGQNGMKSKITVLMWQGAAGCLWWKSVTSSGAWMLSQGSHELCSIPNPSHLTR